MTTPERKPWTTVATSPLLSMAGHQQPRLNRSRFHRREFQWKKFAYIGWESEGLKLSLDESGLGHGRFGCSLDVEIRSKNLAARVHYIDSELFLLQLAEFFRQLVIDRRGWHETRLIKTKRDTLELNADNGEVSYTDNSTETKIRIEVVLQSFDSHFPVDAFAEDQGHDWKVRAKFDLDPEYELFAIAEGLEEFSRHLH